MTESLNIDLHTHSWCSDGALGPAALVARAATAGVQVLALTDHDTTAGLEEAARRGSELGLRLVPGVEISCAWRMQSIHVLGLWIDPACATLRQALDAQSARREQRMREICRHLSRIGLPGEELLQAVAAQARIPTRAHLAAAMIERGLARSTDDVFRKYLRRGEAGRIAANWPAMASAIGWIVICSRCVACCTVPRIVISFLSYANDDDMQSLQCRAGLGATVAKSRA